MNTNRTDMLELSDKNFKAAMKKATMINMLKAKEEKKNTKNRMAQMA